MALDILLLPNCDLHVALNGTPPLTLHVFTRDLAADGMSYVLADVTPTCTFDFFAPYNPVGNRLQQFAAINPANGVVTPTAVGTNLVQIRFGSHYIIARLQVHDRILGWWFGNSSVTTARHNRFAHAQPSIYALFSDDASGTDLVGDITGHGYVPLTSNNASVFTVNANGRLQGVAEGDATVSGTFLATTHSLPVKVVDYAKLRATLDYVQIPNVEHPETMHNILFIPEGFRNTTDDRKQFDKIVTKVVDEMFDKPRHSPYNLLEGGFNIWKAYEPSQQHAVTCGFRVNDEEVEGLGKGYPIPLSSAVSTNPAIYTVQLLVRIVGLPLRNEARTTAQLTSLWGSQSLNNFVAAKVDDNLIKAWKSQKSLGILEARDTFFGLYLGTRYGDRRSAVSNPVVAPPAADNQLDPNLAPFIKRVYEWFTIMAARTLSPDPRRHPPELQAGNRTNAGNSIMRYISGLQGRFTPHPSVGLEWTPDPHDATFKKSRGLVALITNEGVIGGANFNNLTITGLSLAKNSALLFEYANAGNERVMRRTPPNSVDEDIDDIIDTVAHEFGHSFNLGDEYEDFPNDDPQAGSFPNVDTTYDNLGRLAAINLNANFLVNRQVDPEKVKWFDLFRIRLSDRLIKNSETTGGQIKVTIDKRFIGKWVAAKQQNLEAYLRRPDFTATGRQLPLKFDTTHFLTQLVIGDISQTDGTILLGGPELPPTPFPVFPADSLLFVPRRDAAGNLSFVVEKKVLDKLKATNLPLNKVTDVATVNKEADDPIDIADFKPPCKSYKLIGIYEGANYFSGMTYRPAGLCKMRKSSDAGTGDGEFCHVCKYLIVNRVDPGLHDLLDKKHYPEAKKNG